MNISFAPTLLAISLMIACSTPEKQSHSTSEEIPRLTIHRQLSASPQTVFATFTNPEDMKIWWTDSTSFEIDLKVGGTWTINRKEGETLYTATGTYLAVENPNRLVYTYSMPQFSPNSDTISIDIIPNGESGSELTFVVSGKDIASELTSLAEGDTSASEKGWRMGFDIMEKAWTNPK